MFPRAALPSLLLVVALPLLGACAPDRDPGPQVREDVRGPIQDGIREAVREARRGIARENITISHDGHPKAEITSKGDLLIDGRAVALTPEQRALLLEYRGHIAAVAEMGMEIGTQGADVAATAVGEALKGVFAGKSGEEIERTVEAEAAKIKRSAARLCDRLPAMMAAQQKAAAAIPAFRPYATMSQDNIDDCRRDTAREG